MKVIVKEPHMAPEIREVEGICGINRIVGNVDDNGNGVCYAGSDYRMSIGKNIDMYVNTFSVFNPDMEENIWDPSNSFVYCGNVVFAGFDREKYNRNEEYGACSLNREQIDLCIKFIARQQS